MSRKNEIKELVNRVDFLEDRVYTLQKFALAAITGGAVIAIGNMISNKFIKVTDDDASEEEGGEIND